MVERKPTLEQVARHFADVYLNPRIHHQLVHGQGELPDVGLKNHAGYPVREDTSGEPGVDGDDGFVRHQRLGDGIREGVVFAGHQHRHARLEQRLLLHDGDVFQESHVRRERLLPDDVHQLAPVALVVITITRHHEIELVPHRGVGDQQ